MPVGGTLPSGSNPPESSKIFIQRISAALVLVHGGGSRVVSPSSRSLVARISRRARRPAPSPDQKRPGQILSRSLPLRLSHTRAYIRPTSETIDIVCVAGKLHVRGNRVAYHPCTGCTTHFYDVAAYTDVGQGLRELSGLTTRRVNHAYGITTHCLDGVAVYRYILRVVQSDR